MFADNENALTADETGYKVSLLRVAPGNEQAVANRLKRAISWDTHEKPVALLKIFGRYDICAIYRTKDFLDGPSKLGPISGIRGATKILAFHWRASNEPPGLSVEKAKGNVWALSFFRFNEPLLKAVGAEIELALAKMWHSQRDVTLDVLGTTGWAELLLVLRGDSLQQIRNKLCAISREVIGTMGGEIPLPAKTWSIIGINFDLTLPRNRKKLRASLSERFSADSGVFPVLNITCPPAAMDKVYKYCQSHFGTGAEVFGATDFLFRPRASSWGKFISDLLDFRKKMPSTVYSTSVNILTVPNDFVGDIQVAIRSGFPLKMPFAESPTFLRWGATLEHRLRNVYFSLSNLLQDPLIGSCFEDLRQMAASYLPDLLKTRDPANEDDTRLVDEIVELLAYATEERAHGAFLSLEHLEASLSPTKGGVQRILSAASFLPRSLLARVRKRWHGFMVAGYHNKFFASRCEILNLPFEYLFRPEEWCGLLHEIGHAAFFDKTFYDMDSKEMSNLIHQAVPAAKESDEYYMKWEELAWEIGADTFDLFFCYGKDLDSYLRNILPFITHGSKRLTMERFRRYFVVYEFWKRLLVPDRDSFGHNFTIGREIVEFDKRLASLDPKVVIDSNAHREAEMSFAGMARIAEVFFKKFRQFGDPRQLDAELHAPYMEGALNSVSAGRPWLGYIKSPDTFILGLKKCPQLNLASRLAAIVSLWHSANVRQSDA
jgi:hypothetical protein